MEFRVADRRTIERGLIIRTPYVVISVRDPKSARPRIPKRVGLRAVLSLAFHDAEPTQDLALPRDIRLFTRDQARKIWSFVQEHQESVGTIVCHCEQGMSRSPAIAIALAEALGDDAEAIRRNTQPNLFVYRLVREATQAAPPPDFDNPHPGELRDG